MLLLYADYSVLNLCMCEDTRNAGVISEASFRGSLDEVHFLSALKGHLKDRFSGEELKGHTCISLIVDFIR